MHMPIPNSQTVYLKAQADGWMDGRPIDGEMILARS